MREVYRSKNGKVSISSNVKGFRWPTREEKIAGLLECGMIDQAEADRLRALAPTPTTVAAERGGRDGE